jgi:hypothetical protein
MLCRADVVAGKSCLAACPSGIRDHPHEHLWSIASIGVVRLCVCVRVCENHEVERQFRNPIAAVCVSAVFSQVDFQRLYPT